MNHDIWLRVEGSLLERLVQRALTRGASFAHIRRIGSRALLVAADKRSADILMELCRKYSLDCRLLSRGGRAALADLLRARWTVLPGLLLCALICSLCLSRIWLVDVVFTGPSAHLGDRQAILNLLEAADIRAGMYAGDVNADLLQKQLMASAGDFSFVGVRRQGVRLLVEASPEVPAPEIYAIDHARDLVASRDGVIESVTVHSGDACVKPGDTVRRGQLLIRGEEAVGKDAETGEEITAPVSALGEVRARCWYEGGAEGYIEYSVSRRTGKSQTGVRLKLMDLSIELAACDGYPSEEIETQILPVVGLFLPLEIKRSVHYETAPSVQSMDPAQLEARLADLARAEALSAVARDRIQYEIASQWTDATRNGNTMRVRAIYEIYTDIAVTRDALTEEVY